MPFYKCDGQHPLTFDQEEIVKGLREARQAWRAQYNRLDEVGEWHLPSPQAVDQAIKQLSGALFPMRLGPDGLVKENEDFYVGYTIGVALSTLLSQIKHEIKHRHHEEEIDECEVDNCASKIVREFAKQLPRIRTLLDSDIKAAYAGDPAARSVDEVLLCYPGVQAMIYHRLAHELYKLDMTLTARIIAELSHSMTGIDIHPGAQIGPGCFIDHGTGVVIGETAIIGQNVRIYQAVTLGAKSFPANEDGTLHKGLARHPIVEDDVVIYASATILGRITIGKGAVIGGNTWVTQDVAPGEFVSMSGSSRTKKQDFWGSGFGEGI
ncbi:serine acetyltransferase [Pelistega sp. NLN82]|uniref:serine O-acetyltransferase n=1 Tax=Pelistega ratti TaxID=2652177 RepID=A0A6L9Y9M5_9BURK|nr:serine O-acetyltransferase EpsC [Pelistega ratti]NEN76508.1 serine acetyltransferase [Pelistega ratti]